MKNLIAIFRSLVTVSALLISPAYTAAQITPPIGTPGDPVLAPRTLSDTTPVSIQFNRADGESSHIALLVGDSNGTPIVFAGVWRENSEGEVIHNRVRISTVGEYTGPVRVAFGEETDGKVSLTIVEADSMNEVEWECDLVHFVESTDVELPSGSEQGTPVDDPLQDYVEEMRNTIDTICPFCDTFELNTTSIIYTPWGQVIIVRQRIEMDSDGTIRTIIVYDLGNGNKVIVYITCNPDGSCTRDTYYYDYDGLYDEKHEVFPA